MGTVADSFTRTASNGWGTASTGQGWAISGGSTADYSVTGALGRQSNTAVNTLHHSYLETGSLGQTVVARAVIPVVPTGGGVSAWVLGRMTDASNYYAATLNIGTSGAASLVIQKRVAGSLSSVTASVGVGTHAAGNNWGIKLSVAGSAVRAKAWKTTDAEPSTWAVEGTDTALPSGTLAGLASRTEAGNTNGTVNIDWDDFSALPLEITATQQDAWPPRVLVSVTGLTIGDNVEVYRSVAGRETLLRGAAANGVSDTSFLRTDAELPFGVPVRYLAFVNGSERYYTSYTTYALPGGKVAVSDAINGNAAEVVILAWDEKAYSRRASVFKVGGRNVVVSGDLGMFEGAIELFTETTSAKENLQALLAEATEGVIQIRQPGGYDGVDSYLAVLGVIERRHSQDGSDQRRISTLDVAEVEGWAPALEAQGFTLQDIADIYTGTLADLSNDYPTLLDIAQGDFSA